VKFQFTKTAAQFHINSKIQPKIISEAV